MSLLKPGYILLSYLLGSVLFAELSMRLCRGQHLTEVSENHNPGVSNAFRYGGVLCGLLAVVGDVGKGALPVWLYGRLFGGHDFWLTFLMLATAAGHAWPLFFHFRGGMCIAVSFGLLLGLLPQYMPLLILVVLYLSFLAFRRHSNSMITLFVYVLLSLFCVLLAAIHQLEASVLAGILSVSCLVCIRIWPDLTASEQARLLHRSDVTP